MMATSPTRSRDCGSRPQTTAMVQPAPPVDDLVDDNNVAELFSRLQSPSKTPCPQGSPTPQLRQSKTPKYDVSSCAGNFNPVAAIGMDLDNSDDNNISAVNLMQDIIATDDTVYDGTADVGNEMTVDVENSSSNSTIFNVTSSITMEETIAVLASGELQPDNVVPGRIIKYPQLLHDSIKDVFLAGGMNADSLARKTKSEVFRTKDNTPWGGCYKSIV